MSTTGQMYPGASTTASESPWSDNDWVTPENVYADDGSTANVTAASFDNGDQTYVLKAYSFDLSSIPDGATIDGVICRVNTWYRSGQGSGSFDLMMLLDTSLAKVGTNQCSTPVVLTTNDATVITKGGSADKWGNDLTAAWVKSSNFGVALGIKATANNADVDIDYVTLEVYYTYAPPPIEGSLDEILGTLTIEAAAGVLVQGILDEAFGTLTLSASGSVEVEGILDKSFGVMACQGTGTVEEGGVQGSLDIVLGSLVQSGSGSVLVSGALEKILGPVSLSASGAVDISGVLEALLDSLTCQGTGEIGGPVQGSLNQVLGALTCEGNGKVLVSGSMNVILGPMTREALPLEFIYFVLTAIQQLPLRGSIKGEVQKIGLIYQKLEKTGRI